MRSDEFNGLKIQLIFIAREGARKSIPEGVEYYNKEQEALSDVGRRHVWHSVQLKLRMHV
jgi:hypothetical protein